MKTFPTSTIPSEVQIKTIMKYHLREADPKKTEKWGCKGKAAPSSLCTQCRILRTLKLLI